MMKLLLISALFPLCLGLATNDTCMNLVPSFQSLTSGTDLRVCSRSEQQCCMQEDEDYLGMTLSSTLRYNHTLGVELEALYMNASALNDTLTYLAISLVQDVLRPLMNASVDRTITASYDDLDRIRDDVLSNIRYAILSRMDANLTELINRYFIYGTSSFYLNISFPGETLENVECGINVTYDFLYSPGKIADFGRILQQIKVAYDVTRQVLDSIPMINQTFEDFITTNTCNYTWTRQYACPLCAGQATPLCERRCDEVLIGCFSSLQQVIVQLNVLLDFTRASISSLLTGNPFAGINLNNLAANYTGIFNTTLTTEDILRTVSARCSSRKRSVESPVLRQKRQQNVAFPSVSINETVVTVVNNTLQTITNISLTDDRIILCGLLRANGSSDNCTIGVGDIAAYMSTFDQLEIADQENNPTGVFNTSELRYQARLFPYVMTNFLNRSDVRELYYAVLPGRPEPSLDFLDDIDVTSTTTTVVVPTPTPTMSPPSGGGGSKALSFSMLTTLVALLLARIM